MQKGSSEELHVASGASWLREPEKGGISLRRSHGRVSSLSTSSCREQASSCSRTTWEWLVLFSSGEALYERDTFFSDAWRATCNLPWSSCPGCSWHPLWEALMGKSWKTLSSQGQVSPKPAWDGDSPVCCRVEVETLGTASLLTLNALSPGWGVSHFVVLTWHLAMMWDFKEDTKAHGSLYS